MSDIADFVTARIADDEAVVRGATARHHPARDLWVSDWPPEGQLGVSSARMRVELEAKRRLVAWARARGDEHALRVLAIVARPFALWKVALIVVMSGLSALMFVLPVTQRLFLLDPGNLRYTTLALALAGVGVVLVEIVWWVDGWLTGEPRRVFARPADTAETADTAG